MKHMRNREGKATAYGLACGVTDQCQWQMNDLDHELALYRDQHGTCYWVTLHEYVGDWGGNLYRQSFTKLDRARKQYARLWRQFRKVRTRAEFNAALFRGCDVMEREDA